MGTNPMNPIDGALHIGPHRMIGRGGISRYIKGLARSHFARRDSCARDRVAARDAARERETRAWTGPLAAHADNTRVRGVGRIQMRSAGSESVR